METIELKKIKIDLKILPDMDRATDYALDIRNHQAIEPIIISKDFKLISGLEQLLAYRLLGKDQVPVIIRED